MIYRLGDFSLDCERYRLLRGEEPVPIEPLALELLVYLIEHRDRLVPKQELLEALWAERFVSDAVLARCVHEARRALGDDADQQTFIKTVRGRGYRFGAEVEEISTAAPSATEASSSRQFRRRLWLAGALVLLTAAAVTLRWTASETAASRLAEAEPAEWATTEPAIAVLPFANLSPDPEQAYLGDGLAEELIDALSRAGLPVIARTSAFSFKKSEADLAEIGEQLGVETVLEGSVRQEGERLRITVRLSEAESGRALWSQRYDKEMGDVFRLQDEIARAVLARLGVEPEAAVIEAPTSNVLAWELCRRSWDHSRRWDEREELETAVTLARQAIELDPEYGLAHAYLGFYYSALGNLGHWPREGAFLLAHQTLDRAQELDDGRAQTYSVLTWLRVLEGDVEGAEHASREALRRNPYVKDALAARGIALRALGRYDEAIQCFRRSVALDPLDPESHAFLGAALYQHAHRYEEARVHLERKLEMHPGDHLTRRTLINLYRNRGLEDEAVEQTLVYYDDRWPELARELREVHRAWGAGAVWQRELDRLIESYDEGRRESLSHTQYVPISQPQEIANRYYWLGQLEEALSWWERARADGADLRGLAGYGESDTPQSARLRTDPRFLALLETLGLEIDQRIVDREFY